MIEQVAGVGPASFPLATEAPTPGLPAILRSRRGTTVKREMEDRKLPAPNRRYLGSRSDRIKGGGGGRDKVSNTPIRDKMCASVAVSVVNVWISPGLTEPRSCNSP